MKPSARLFQCSLCDAQTLVCSKCDRGHIYCSADCAATARSKSLKAAGKRYQATTNGKRNHAARQARYEMRCNTNLTHHTSLLASQYAPMQQLENNTEKTEKDHRSIALICCFCNTPVSDLLRHDFLHLFG